MILAEFLNKKDLLLDVHFCQHFSEYHLSQPEWLAQIIFNDDPDCDLNYKPGDDTHTCLYEWSFDIIGKTPEEAVENLLDLLKGKELTIIRNPGGKWVEKDEDVETKIIKVPDELTDWKT